MNKSPLTIGSKSATSALNTEPQTTTVRQIKGVTRWFVPTADNKDILCQFLSGIMLSPKFNPKADVIKDVSCGSGRISESDATGVLSILESPRMPKDAVRTCILGYDTDRKIFFDQENPNVVFDAADYLILSSSGRSQVGWKK